MKLTARPKLDRIFKANYNRSAAVAADISVAPRFSIFAKIASNQVWKTTGLFLDGFSAFQQRGGPPCVRGQHWSRYAAAGRTPLCTCENFRTPVYPCKAVVRDPEAINTCSTFLSVGTQSKFELCASAPQPRTKSSRKLFLHLSKHFTFR